MFGAVHKRRPQSGGRGVCPVRTRGEGFFRCGRPHFLVQKTLDFSKFMVCPHGQGEVNFCDFVQTSFMDGPFTFSSLATQTSSHRRICVRLHSTIYQFFRSVSTFFFISVQYEISDLGSVINLRF